MHFSPGAVRGHRSRGFLGPDPVSPYDIEAATFGMLHAAFQTGVRAPANEPEAEAAPARRRGCSAAGRGVATAIGVTVAGITIVTARIPRSCGDVNISSAWPGSHRDDRGHRKGSIDRTGSRHCCRATRRMG
jgi:hypothetical protein